MLTHSRTGMYFKKQVRRGAFSNSYLKVLQKWKFWYIVWNCYNCIILVLKVKTTQLLAIPNSGAEFHFSLVRHYISNSQGDLFNEFPP